jgi:hypothetical protein
MTKSSLIEDEFAFVLFIFIAEKPSNMRRSKRSTAGCNNYYNMFDTQSQKRKTVDKALGETRACNKRSKKKRLETDVNFEHLSGQLPALSDVQGSESKVPVAPNTELTNGVAEQGLQLQTSNWSSDKDMIAVDEPFENIVLSEPEPRSEVTVTPNTELDESFTEQVTPLQVSDILSGLEMIAIDEPFEPNPHMESHLPEVAAERDIPAKSETTAAINTELDESLTEQRIN